MQNRILDEAQSMAQLHGFNGFSFRDIAASVGIKPASIHYYFQTKEQLGVALVRRYTDQLAQELQALSAETSEDAKLLRGYVKIFRTTLNRDGRMCLYGMFAAEVDDMPAAVRVELQRFVDVNVGWIADLLMRGSGATDRDPGAESRARAIFASLEGAMLVARGSGDIRYFDEMVETYASAGLFPS